MSKKPSLSCLRILDLFHRFPGCRIVGSSSIGVSHYYLKMKGEVRSERIRLDGIDADYPRLSADTMTTLVREKWLVRVEKPEGSAWYDIYYNISRRGAEIYAENLERFREYERKEQEKREAAKRLIVISSRDRYSGNRKYAALCEVQRETGKRVYVKVIRRFDGESESSWAITMGLPIDGRGDNQYISKDDITIDNASEDLFSRLVSVEKEKIEDQARLKQEMEDELEPIRERYRQRREQQEAMYEDMESDILRSS